MDTTYRLTQTGKQVQDLLDQVTPNEVNIAAETQRATAAEQAIHGDVSAETTRAEGAEAALQNNINSEESARIAADAVLEGKIDAEKDRAIAAEQSIHGDVSAETTRAESAEAALQGNIEAEANARQSADIALQGSINTEASARQSADAGLQGKIDAEEARAKAAEQANATDIDVIESKIPSEASAQNQLADKSYVNSSVATATATFKGTYNLVSDLHLNVGATRAQIITELNATIQNADSNDYCFVQIPVATSKPTEIAAVDRYKFNGNTWAFEYSLNNSGYTEAQWDAINSGITSGLVTKLNALPTNSDLVNLLAGKQDVLTFDTTPRANSTNPVTSEGIKAAIDAASGGSTSALDAEIERAQAAEQALQGDIDAEETRARAAEQANATAIAGIEEKIPADASAQNQLADKSFVNSSVSTATATFRGTYNEVTDLHLTTAATRANIATALASTIQNADNNDYCFVQIPTADATPTVIARVERCKFDGTSWAFEYELNNSGFTQAQWDALNSGITSGLVAKLNDLPTNSELTTLLAGKQDVIADLATIRSGAAAGATAYQLPGTGVPKSDLSQGVQDSLDAADSAAPQSTTYTKTEVDGLVDAEETRAKVAEQANADDIDVIEAKIPSAATSQNQLADKAYVDAGLAGKQDALTFDQTPTANSKKPVTSTGIKGYVDTAVGNEETRAKAAEQVNALAIDDVEALIPTQASAQNQLADKAFVNSSIATNTGDFVGTYNSLAEMQSDNPNPNNNDYGYVVSTDQQGNQSYSRYKYSSSSQTWEFEYALNNSSFTADEWAAIQSGITAALVGKLGDLYTKAQLDVILDSKQSALTFDNVPTAGSDNPVKSGGIYNALAGKEDTISDLASIRSGASAGATAYQLPSAGIPKTDLASGVQDSLDAADTAYQKPSTGIPETDLDAATQQKINTAVDISGKADKVSGATAGDFAGLDANGNLTDSGKKASDFATAAQGALADTAYQKPQGGIPDTDLSSAVQTSLGKADTAIQDVSGKADKVSGATENDFAGLDANGNLKDSGKKASDFATAAQGALADTAYQKPQGGIPDTDLSSAVQTSLGKADTAIQDVSGKADKVSGATENDFAGLDANGNLKDSGKKASDFATAAQGALADTAYQKPQGGIPDTDLASSVNTSLGKADTAYQKPSGGIPYADLAADAKGLPIGAGTATSLASLPVTNRLIIATISANQSAVSISNGVSALPAGAELHVIIHATAAVTITLPTSIPYVNCNAESALEVASGGYAELNFVSDGTNIYVRGIV